MSGGPLRRGVLALLAGYKRWISPLLPPACRFTPTCSEYATIAVAKYGILSGLGRTTWRILRCNPLHPGGVDLP